MDTFAEWAEIAARYDTHMACAMLRALAEHIEVRGIVRRCLHERRVYEGLEECFANTVSALDACR